MRKNKIVAVMLLVFVLALSFVLTACVTDEHQCTSKCPECGKCLNKECTQEACKEKCPGHEEKPEHVCGHKCPTCGKCTDTTCTDPVCADKCPGHEPTPPAHECTSKCPVCGKCTNKDCTEEVCKDKCQGHENDQHKCQHVCATCGGCYDETCTDPVCSTKCDCISGLENAKEYVRTLYIDASKEATSANYDLVDHVRVKEPHSGVMTDYAITWTITVDASVPVPATVAKGEGKWTVTVSTDKFSKDQPYKLVATVTDSEGNTLTTSFNRYVPAYKVLSYDEFVKADSNADVAVQGIVTGIVSKTNGNKSNGLYLQSLDNKGGFYIYNMANDPVTDKIEVGMKVEAVGKKDVFNGTLQVIDATVTVLEKTPATVTPVDFTEIFKAAAKLDDTTLTYGQALLVKLTGVTVLAQDDDTSKGYYKFQLGDKTSYVRISSSTCPMVKDAQTTMIANHKAKTGYTADVVGLVTLYSGSFYLTPVSADAFSNFKLNTLTGQEAINAEKANVTLTENVYDDTTITLPTTGKTYSTVAITWSFKADTTHTTATLDGTTLKLVPGETAEAVTLVATFTDSGVTDTAEFTINVAAKAVNKDSFYQTVITSAPTVDKEYYLGLYKRQGDVALYFTGAMDGYYFATTETIAEALAVKVVSAGEDGSFYLTCTYNGKTQYVCVYASGKFVNIGLKDAADNKYTWNTEYNTLQTMIDNTPYFIGSRETFTTISASKASYFTGTNATKIDISQYPIRLIPANSQPDPTPATDAEKVAAAEKAIGTTLTISKVGENELYTSTDVTVTWAIKGETTLATLAGNKLTVAALPTDADGTFTLTATIKSGEVEKTVDVTVTVKKVFVAPTTPEEIVNAAWELKEGETLEGGTYRLTGTIISIDEAYSESYGNITVKIVVGNLTDKPIICFRMKGDYASKLAVNDVITVEGTLVNFNGKIEFNSGCTVKEYIEGTSTITVEATNATVAITDNKTSGVNGTTFTFTVTVAEGYELVSVKVNGTVVEATEGTYTGTINGNTIILVETKVIGQADPVVVASLTFPDGNKSKISSYTDTWTATINSVSWTLTNFNNNNNGWNYVKCGRKKTASVATIVNAEAMTDSITKIALTIDAISANLVNSIKLVVASDASFSDDSIVETITGNAVKGEQIFNIKTPTAGMFYKFVFDCAAASSNGTVQISKIDYYAVK